MSNELLNIFTEVGKTDVVQEYIKAAFVNGPELSMFIDFGLTTVGIVSAIIQSRNIKKNSILIQQELKKVHLALKVIDEKMRKHNIKQLINYHEVNINPKRYQFVHNVFQEAVNAKSDYLREYCASTIIYTGVADYSESLDYRKLYRTLKIIQELDDLDIELISYYDLHVQMNSDNSINYMEKINSLEQSIISNESYTPQELFLSTDKMARLGLLNYGSNSTQSSEAEIKSVYLTELVVLNQAKYPTQVYLDFNKHVHTFL